MSQIHTSMDKPNQERPVNQDGGSHTAVMLGFESLEKAMAFTDEIMRRLGRIERHLIDIRGNTPRVPKA